jgi:hypothetical protein
MEGLFILFVVGLVFRALTKSAKRAGGGARPVPPPRPAVPPLTPAARPGDGQAGWQEIMTMLSASPRPSGRKRRACPRSPPALPAA